MTKTIEAMPFDPWAGVAPARTARPDDPESPPLGWDDLTATIRGRVGGALVATLAQYPDRHARGDADFLQHRAWETMRVDRAVELGVAEAQITSPFILRDAIAKLLAAGDLVTTLRQRRAAIDAQLTRLERMKAGGR